MKKLFLIGLLLLSSNFIFSQEENTYTSFSALQIGVYGGFNFETSSEIGGSFLFEGGTNLTSTLNLKLSFGYYRSFESIDFISRSYGEITIDSLTFYAATSREITKKVYDVFPFSLGFQYLFRNKTLSPYLTIAGNYNLISPSLEKGGGQTWYYDSIDEIPDEFKESIVLDIPYNSYGVAVGAGIIYQISKNIGLDLRYFYKYDSEIINTHHILVGIVF